MFNLFRKDPEAQLKKAESLLKAGEPRKALKLALTAAETHHPGVGERARLLAVRARERLVKDSLEKASAAEESEYWEDALEWLEMALEDAPEGSEKAEIQERVEKARSMLLEEDRPDWQTSGEMDVVEPGPMLTGQEVYQALVNMLRDDVAARYRDRPQAFCDAVLALNEGRPALAGAALDSLVDRDQDDPVLRLERARARLAEGQWQEAAADLEAAWQTLGDEPLDLAGEFSIPALWAQAKLQDKDAAQVVDRLHSLAEPTASRRDLLLPFGRALREAGQLDEARSFLAQAAQAVPENPFLSYELASVLADQGLIPQAVDVLETAIAPSCATGGCRRPPRHIPSFRLLTSFYLSPEGDPARARELLQLIVEEQQGRATKEDLELLEKYHQATGDVGGAKEARRSIEELEGTGA